MSFLSFISRPFVLLFTALDRFLVWAATPFGVRVADSHRRYVRFVGVYAAIYLLGALPLPVVPLVALAVGYVGILAVGRAWVWNEKERSLIAKKLKDGNPDEMPDLRGLALASALQLLVLFPLIFFQVHREFGFYEVPEGATFWVWIGFTLDSYNKAFLNVFEAYGVHLHHVRYDSPWGRHLMVLCRATFDFILIQGVFRLIAIRQTVAEAVEAIQRDGELVVRLGRRALVPLLAVLEDRNGSQKPSASQVSDPGSQLPHLRASVATALGALGDRKAVEPLIAVLGDADEVVRCSAAQTLGDLGDARAVGPLIAVLNDPHSAVRSAAAESLARLRDLRAVEPLINALSGADEFGRSSAAAALGELGDRRAVEPLIKSLESTDSNLRYSAAQALGYLGDTRAVEPLIRALQDTTAPVRWIAAGALGLLKDKRAVVPLIAALQDTVSTVPKWAAESLGTLGEVQAVEPLVSFLSHPDERVRMTVAEALGQLGDERAVEPLTLARQDENTDVRDKARKALKQLGRPEAPKSSVESQEAG